MRHTNPVLQPSFNGQQTPGGQITCPSCGEMISLSEALRTEYADKFEKEFQKRAQVAASLIKQKEDLLAKKAQLLDREYLEKLAQERAKLERDLKNQITEEISKRITEEQRFKIAEKDKQLEDMRNKIEELKRKSELTSQQLQGEVLELELETTLKKFCIIDSIEPVAKGARGGDIVQKVMTTTGQHVGTIVWEAKRTKNWTDGWIDKIKEDQRAISAECAVIVSDHLPKGIANLGLVEGVWVCDTKTAQGLASALRLYLLQVFAAKASVAGKDAKMEVIYKYLTGTQFAQRIQSLVETFRDMQDSLLAEKKAYHKIWSQREQQLEKMVLNTASVYGSIQGIVGGALPRIEALELPAG